MPRKASPEAPKGLEALIAEPSGRDGVFTTEDASRCGVSPAAITRGLKKGRVVRLFPRVYVVTGAGRTWWTDARAAAAWSRGALSHRSADFAHGLVQQPPNQIDVVGRAKRTPPRGSSLRCHRSELVDPPHIVTVRGIAVTAPARTLLDMAPAVPDEVLEAALEESLRRGLVSMARLEWQLRTEGRKGRGGTTSLRRLLEARGSDVAAAESILETKVARWFRSTTLPPPVRQYRVRTAGRFIARVDFAYPEARVAVEAISYRWHSGRRAWLRDEERYRDLRDLGWVVIKVTEEDLCRPGRSLEEEIAGALHIALF